MEYICSNLEANRLRLVSATLPSTKDLRSDDSNLQLSQVACGVTYLHELGIEHGDLKGVRYHSLHNTRTADVSYRRTSSLTTREPLVLGISV
jgi:serine/threonine protein kinase